MTSRIIVNNIQSDTGISTITISSPVNLNGGFSVGTGVSIASPATNVLTINTNNTERIRVGAAGSIGIGTDNPQRLIDISGSATTGLTTTGRFQLTPHALGFDIASTAGNIAPHYQTNFSLYTGQIGSGTLRWQINSNGQMTVPFQPSIELNGKLGTDVDFTSSAQLLTSTYYNQILNRGGIGWNSSTGVITVPTTGYYFISMFVYCNSAGNGDGRLQIRTNGANRVVFQVRSTGTNTATLLVNLAANDTVDVIADSFDLPRLYMGPEHTRFNMFLLG
jgi:hypothetical protein